MYCVSIYEFFYQSGSLLCSLNVAACFGTFRLNNWWIERFGEKLQCGCLKAKPSAEEKLGSVRSSERSWVRIQAMLVLNKPGINHAPPASRGGISSFCYFLINWKLLLPVSKIQAPNPVNDLLACSLNVSLSFNHWCSLCRVVSSFDIQLNTTSSGNSQ